MSPSLPTLLPLIALLLTPVVASVLSLSATDNPLRPQVPVGLTPVLDDQVRVPVILGVMSRCPDALLCESIFDSVLKHTWDIVDISLSFLGKCV